MEESNEINREEPKEVTKFTDELNKISELMKGLNEIEELKGQLNKAVDLMNRLKEKEPMSQNEHTTRENEHTTREKEHTTRENEHTTRENEHTTRENELATSENELTTNENKLIINELEKLERFKKELEILESFKRDSVEKLEDQNNMTNVKRNSVWGEVKRWSNIFSSKFISFQKKYEKKAIKVIEGDQPAEKKYRKISKWLRDYKDNQIIVIIFTILAGVDISHLELLGSNLRIKIRSFSFRSLKTQNIDVNFNAELSHAAKQSLFWGDITNIFIEDISAIIIQINTVIFAGTYWYSKSLERYNHNLLFYNFGTIHMIKSEAIIPILIIPKFIILTLNISTLIILLSPDNLHYNDIFVFQSGFVSQNVIKNYLELLKLYRCFRYIAETDQITYITC
ncbi:hypothetical protein RhiirA4_423008 [Rhizophagus irregularis]|uniref:Uncharacterized protein n=1 Tax=Rhizophagus irregularis TaxID=588596 RepID=A0A2I1GSH1_9GLOM|nr:hypothetical protein RhiirA4_423008 [Rhizophagus irregularis]